MGARVEKFSDEMSTRLRYIENRTKELEKLLADNAFDVGAVPAPGSDPADRDDGGREQTARDDGDRDDTDPGDGVRDYDVPWDDGGAATSDIRTERLIRYGRRPRKRKLLRPRNIVIAVAALILLIVIVALTAFGGGASWPDSVTAVKAEILTACQNPDVVSEPGQVNFACAKSTQQVLWVFSLLTSKDDAGFSSSATGREGLEPIAAAQGGEVAWSLNLHQPYNPFSAIDSIQVAARAINNIVGGATVIGSNGKIQVEPGLESDPSNCARYTGSSAVISHVGYPSLCALPVSTADGQAALVRVAPPMMLFRARAATARLSTGSYGLYG